MNHVCYSEGRKVATVFRNRFGRWVICWHSRADSRENIANPEAAKRWIAHLLDGKEVEWRKEKP